VIVLFLFILLRIELQQDRKMLEYYQAHSQTCLPLDNGLYECQTCGCTQVKPGQKSCTICGTAFADRC
jgi:rubrerythrin